MASQPNSSSDGPQGRSYTSPAQNRPMYPTSGSYDARPGPQGFVPPPAVNDAFGAYLNSAPTFRRDNVSVYGGSEPAAPLTFGQRGLGVPSRMNSHASARYYRNPFHEYEEARLPFGDNSKWQQQDGEGAARNLRRPVRQSSKGFVANDPFRKAKLGKKRDEIPDDLTFDKIDAYPTGYTPAAPPRPDPPLPLVPQPSAASPTSFHPQPQYGSQPMMQSSASQPPNQAYQSTASVPHRPLSFHSYHAAQSPIQPQQTGSSSVPNKRPQASIYPQPHLLQQLVGYSQPPPASTPAPPQRFSEPLSHSYPPLNSNSELTSSATPPPRPPPLSPTGTPPPGHEPSRHSFVMNDFSRTTFGSGLEDRNSLYPAPPLTAITEQTEPSQTGINQPHEDGQFTRPFRHSFHPYEEYPSVPYDSLPYRPGEGFGDALDVDELPEFQVSPDFSDEKEQTWWDKTVSFFAFVGIILFLPIILPLRFLRRKKKNNTYKFDGSQAYHEVSPSESSTQVPSKVDIAVVVIKRIPRVIYHHVLLRLPSLYFSRVARIFEEADLSLNDLKAMALELASKNLNTAPHMAHYGIFEVGGRIKMPPAYESLKHTWEEFINNLLREWKTFNLISVLLLSAILTILQIDAAGKDPFTRYFALSSLICALVSLLYGCIYIIRFGTMRKPYKAAEWALEARKSRTVFYWSVWVMLAMPAVYLAWSLLLFICCIMAFVWRTGLDIPEKDGPEHSPTPVGETHMIILRGVVSAILALGLIYGVLIVATFQRYGQRMDRAWRKRIDGWIEEKAAIEEELEERKCAGEYGYQPPSQPYPASAPQPQAPPPAPYRAPGEGAGQAQRDRSATLRNRNEEGSKQRTQSTNQRPGAPFSGPRRATVRDEDSDADSIGKRSDEDESDEEGNGGMPDIMLGAVNFSAKAAVLPPIRSATSLNIQRTTTPESVASLGRDSGTQFSIEMLKKIEEEDEEMAPSISGHSLTQGKRGRSEGVKAVPEVVREGTKQHTHEAVPHRDKQHTKVINPVRASATHGSQISVTSSSRTSQSSTTIGITKIPPTPETLSTLTSPTPSLSPRAPSPGGSLRRAPPPPPPQLPKKPPISIVTPFVHPPPPPPPPLLTPKVTTSTTPEAAHSPPSLPPPLPPRPPELLEGLETVTTSLVPPSPARTRHEDDGGSPFASSSALGSSTNASPNASFEAIDSEVIPLLRTSSAASESTEFGLGPSLTLESHDYHSPLLSAPTRKGAKPGFSSSYKAGHSPQVSMDDLMKGLSALSSGPASSTASSNSPSLTSGSRGRGRASQETRIRTPTGEISSYSGMANTPPTGSLLLSTPSPSHESSTGATPITPPPATYSGRFGHEKRPSELGVDLLTMPRRASGSGEVTRTVSQERSEGEDEVDIDARLDELFAKKKRGG